MDIVFSNDPLPEFVTNTLFLAGPSPRESGMSNWREDALTLLADAGYKGTVLVPMTREQLLERKFETGFSYEDQIKWEELAMNMADVIMFWVPRNSINLGLTTNVEFGKYLESGRVVYGRPNGAMNTRYLDELCKTRKIGINESLSETIKHALNGLHGECERKGTEVYVPAIVFRSQQFQGWYGNLVKSGNKLGYVKVTSIIGSIQDNYLFGYSINPKVDITAESRYKNNEWVFSRTELSVVGLFHGKGEARRFVLIGEMRPSVNNEMGVIYEFPGGSEGDSNENALENACKELREETGLRIDDSSRLVDLGKRQALATYLGSRLNLYGLELTDEEFQEVNAKAQEGKTLGENAEERIHLVCATRKELNDIYPVDLTTLGIVHLLEDV